MRVTRTVVLTAAVVALAAITACSSSGGARGSPRDIPEPSVVCEEGQAPSEGVCADTVPPAPEPRAGRSMAAPLASTSATRPRVSRR